MVKRGPRMLNTANRALWFVLLLADIKNPKASEINAGINLTALVTVNNYQFGVTGNAVISDPALRDKIESDVPGLAKAEAKFDMFRYKDEADDIAWTTFDGANIAGYLVERVGQIEDGEDQDLTPVKATDVLTIAEVLTHDQIPQSPANAGYEKFTQPFSIQDFQPRVTVVAGP
jgi:hypothetical protein